MTILQSQSLSVDALKVRFKEQYGSAGLNKKFLGMLPRGVFAGFKLAPNGTLGGVNCDVLPDSGLGFSGGTFNTSTSGKYAVTAVLESMLTFDLNAQRNTTVYFVLDVQYATGATTAGQVKVVDAAELAAHPELVVIGQVNVPNSGALATSHINQGYRTVAGDNVLPLTQPKFNLIGGSFDTRELFSPDVVPQFPVGWSTAASTGSIVLQLDNVYPRTGRLGINILGASFTGTVGSNSWVLGPLVPVVEGEEYQVGVWLRTTNTSFAGSVYLMVKWYGPSNQVVGSPTSADTAVFSGGTTWVERKGCVVAPSGAFYARFALAVTSPASYNWLWIDSPEFSYRTRIAERLNSDRLTHGHQLPFTMWTLPEDINSGQVNKRVTLETPSFTTSDAYMLQWDTWTVGSGGGFGVKHHLGPNGGIIVGTRTGTPFEYVRLDVSGQGRLVLGKGGHGPATLNHDNLGTLIGTDGVVNADALHSHSASSSPNVIANGKFDFWQRHPNTSTGSPYLWTSTSTGSFLIADRWLCSTRGYADFPLQVSQSALGSSDANGRCINAIRMQRQSGSTNTGNYQVRQEVHRDFVRLLRGQSCRLTFWCRVGANFSGTTVVTINTGTGDENETMFALTYATGNSVRYSATFSATGSWQKFDIDFTVPSDATCMGVMFNTSGVTGTAGVNDWYEITAVDVHVGQQTRDWFPCGGSSIGDFALCQAYFEKSYAAGNGVLSVNAWPVPQAGNDGMTLGWIWSISAEGGGSPISGVPVVRFLTRKRATPEVTLYDIDQTENAVTFAVTGSKTALSTEYNDVSFVAKCIAVGFNTAAFEQVLFNWVADAEFSG